MSEMISDGKGRGFLMSVDNEQRAAVHAITVDSISHISKEHGKAFAFGSFSIPMTLPDVDIWYTMIHLKNTSDIEKFVIRSITTGWNGGDTTGDKVLWSRTIAGYTGPSANFNSVTPGNMNRTSSNTAEVEFYVWDGVGNGIITAGGISGDAGANAKGRNVLDLHDASILGTNDYSAVQLMSSEVGQFTISGLGYWTSLIV